LTLDKLRPIRAVKGYKITGQLIRYAFVGGFGFVLHLSIIALQVELLNVPYWLAFPLALPFTYSTKFLLDKFWTFKA
jgi:putative flippase GtrA